MKVHWGYPDPSNAPEADRAVAFDLTREAIGYRMLQLLQLPLDQMSDEELQAALASMARNRP
jgi:arsenate reductase